MKIYHLNILKRSQRSYLIINKNECEHDNLIKTKRKSKAQSPTNQTLKDELKKKSILKNDKKKNLTLVSMSNS
jgi:transcription elongation factor